MTIDQILLVLLVIAILFIFSYHIWINKSTCVDTTPDTVNGTRIPGIKLASKLGYPTINLKLDRDLRCGFYSATSDYGDAIIIVGKRDPRRADVHFRNFDQKLDRIDTFSFNSLHRIVDERSDVITTFNAGCE
jgi:hypothetical protein